MADATDANRRIHTRRKARIQARLSTGPDAVEGTIENIGEGGVFFATEDLELNVEEGSDVVVSFRCTKAGAAAALERKGCVLRMERYFDGVAVVRAFAIKFDDLMAVDDLSFD